MCRTEDGEKVCKQALDDHDEEWYLRKRDGIYYTKPEPLNRRGAIMYSIIEMLGYMRPQGSVYAQQLFCERFIEPTFG